MAPKRDRFYACGHSKYVALSARLVIGFYDEHDPEYVSPSTATPSRAARATSVTPKKVAPDVVTTLQSDKERTLTGTLSRSDIHEVPAPPHLHSLPHLMRLRVLIPLHSHRLVLSQRLPTSQNDGVSTG